jgi:hypothetical protein
LGDGETYLDLIEMHSSVEAFTVAAFCVLDYCGEKGSNTFRGAALNGGGGQSLVSRTSVIPTSSLSRSSLRNTCSASGLLVITGSVDSPQVVQIR